MYVQIELAFKFVHVRRYIINTGNQMIKIKSYIDI